MSTLGNNIRFLREESNLTQIALADILNVGNVAISQYESGSRVPSDEIKIRIADYFNVTLDFLLGRPQSGIDYMKTKAEILEEEFPEGISLLYKANESLSSDQKAMMLRMIEAAFFKEKDK